MPKKNQVDPSSGVAIPNPKEVFTNTRVDEVDPEVSARAMRARSYFQAQLPNFNAFVKAMTGDDSIRVVMSTGTPRTDGKTIYMRPSIKMGDNLKHVDPRQCGARDPVTSLQYCEACCDHERVLTDFYHETAHILGGSFGQLAEQDALEVILKAVAERQTELGTTRGDKIAARITEQREYMLRVMGSDELTYVAASNLVSPFLAHILNAWEDAYVNRKLFESRPGVKHMFDASEWEIFNAGIENDAGVTRTWAEQPEDAQAIIGLFCKASGYDYHGWFSERVEEFLDSKPVQMLVYKFATCRSPKARYRLSFPTLDTLRGAGFCKHPDDPEDDEQTFGQPGANKEQRDGEPSESGQPGKGQPGDTEQQESDDDAAGAGEQDDQESGPDDADSGAGAGEQESDDDGDSGDSGDGDDAEESKGDTGKSGATNESRDPSSNTEAAGFDGSELGGDSGRGIANKNQPEPEYCDPDEVGKLLQEFGGHGQQDVTDEDEEEEQAVDRAVAQGEYFDEPSDEVFGVDVHRWNRHVITSKGKDKTSGDAKGWASHGPWPLNMEGQAPRRGGDGPWETDPSILGPALLKMRTVFADNQRARRESNLKRGRIDARVLGRRYYTGDPRLFAKKTEPGRRDYFVLIDLDASGSMQGLELGRAKRASMAQADLLSRMGISFAFVAHSGSRSAVLESANSVDMIWIKEPQEPWNAATKDRLAKLHCFGCNVDGQTVEFDRKVLMAQTATDKLLLFYTDGAFNTTVGDAQHTIIVRELDIMKKHNITMVGVEINTRSRLEVFGIDSVTLNSDRDVIKLVRELESRLTKQRAVTQRVAK